MTMRAGADEKQLRGRLYRLMAVQREADEMAEGRRRPAKWERINIMLKKRRGFVIFVRSESFTLYIYSTSKYIV